MRVLSHIYANQVNWKLINEVPRRILTTVARGEGSREPQLVNELTRWLPKTVDPEIIAGWVDETLGWLIVRGDVEREPRGVCRCVPPYLVDPGDLSSNGVLRLHGNPRAEPELLRTLGAFNARLVHGEVHSYSKPEEENVAWPDLGVLERSIALAPADYSAALYRCETQGYTVLRPSDLAAMLPRADDIVSPAERDLTALDNVAAGLWETYDPTADHVQRWGPDDGWQSKEVRLVRWRPSDDWEGNRSARIYYHGGAGRVAELGAETGVLWQFYLDGLYRNPRVIWRNDRWLWVPKALPAATVRWLELLAGLRARFAGPWLRLTMDESAVNLARATLSNTLGLKLRSGYPPREGNRRGGRSGRWER